MFLPLSVLGPGGNAVSSVGWDFLRTSLLPGPLRGPEEETEDPWGLRPWDTGRCMTLGCLLQISAEGDPGPLMLCPLAGPVVAGGASDPITAPLPCPVPPPHQGPTHTRTVCTNR